MIESLLLLVIVIVATGMVWQFGLKRRSLAGALFSLTLGLAAAAITRTDLFEQVSLIMVGVSIGLLVLFIVLVGWTCNVFMMIRWHRQRAAEGAIPRDDLRADDVLAHWFPWCAWYPVHTETGVAWMRMVQARRRNSANAEGRSRHQLEFREMSKV